MSGNTKKTTSRKANKKEDSVASSPLATAVVAAAAAAAAATTIPPSGDRHDKVSSPVQVKRIVRPNLFHGEETMNTLFSENGSPDGLYAPLIMEQTKAATKKSKAVEKEVFSQVQDVRTSDESDGCKDMSKETNPNNNTAVASAAHEKKPTAQNINEKIPSTAAANSIKRKNGSDPPSNTGSDIELDNKDEVETNKKQKAPENAMVAVKKTSKRGAVKSNSKKKPGTMLWPHVFALTKTIKEKEDCVKRCITGISIGEGPESIDASADGSSRPLPCYSNYVVATLAEVEMYEDARNSLDVQHTGKLRLLNAEVFDRYDITHEDITIGTLYDNDGSYYMGVGYGGDTFPYHIVIVTTKVLNGSKLIQQLG